MSSQSTKIPTTTKAARDSLNPSLGDCYYEIDSKKFIYYDGSSWISFGTRNMIDSLVPPGASNPFSLITDYSPLPARLDLNYPGGLFSSPLNRFYVKNSPLFHFDASHPGGLADPSPKPQGARMRVAGDRTRNAFNCVSTNASSNFFLEIDYKGSLYHSNFNKCVPMAAVGSNPYLTPYSITQATHPDMTVFIVGGSTTQSYSAPFAPYGNWFAYGAPGAPTTSALLGKSTSSAYESQQWRVGPSLRFGRRTSSNTTIWDCTSGRIYDGPSGNFSITNLFHTYPAYFYEIILFDVALSISDIITVKDYLQQKYSSIGSNFQRYSNAHSLTFNGTDQYVSTAASTDFSFGTGDFTTSVWLKLSSAPDTTYRCIYDFRGTSYTNSAPALYYSDNNFHRLYAWNQGAGTLVYYNTALSAGQWYHVAYVREGGTGTLYLNGVDVSTGVDSGSYNKASPDLRIGRPANPNAPAGYLDGLINDFSVFGAALQPSEISSLYNRGTPADLSSILLPSAITWWRMGDGATWGGTDWTISDDSGNGHTAQSANMVEADRVTDVP